MITVLILLVALGVLGWGFYRARPLGKLGIVAWLQSVALMLPWLLFFGSAAAGIYINLAGVLSLLVGSTLIYIALGRWLRDLATDQKLERLPTSSKASSIADVSSGMESASPESNAVFDTNAGQKVPSEPTKDPSLPVIPSEDLQSIRGIFGIDTFFAVETIAYQNGAIFKGNLRGEPQASYDRLSANLKGKIGRSLSSVFG